MYTVAKVHTFVHGLAQIYVPKKLQARFLCGVQAFSLQPFQSLNANGRSLAVARKTGEMRTYRLVHDVRFPAVILNLAVRQWLAHLSEVHLSLDHSDYGPFRIAVLAVSLGKGRSLPLWCQVTKGQKAFMRPLLKMLSLVLERLPLGTRQVITMDRWFAAPQLFQFLHKRRVTFICRAKAGLAVIVPWRHEPLPLGEISPEETVCWYGGLQLRLVRSTYRPGMKDPEPWFLLTNDTKRIRPWILRRYKQRFRIEECFKDTKWIQRLEWVRVKSSRTMAVLLCFVFLGWWILWQTMQPVIRAAANRKVHPKQRLSWFRAVYETLIRLCWPEELRFVPLQ